MLNVILVDDEAKARKSLALLLEGFGNVNILAEASDGVEAIKAIAQHHPDLVFLDVKMPRMSGFDVLDSIDRVVLRSFAVVFLTAYDEFAIKAIKYSAFDYLLKPIDKMELAATLNRYISNNKPQSDYDALKSALSQDTKIRIKNSLGYEFIDALDIVYIEGDGNYSCFVLSENDKRMVSRTLKDINNELPGDFIRIHRKYFVNRKYLVSFNKQDHLCCLEKDSVQYKIPVSFRMTKSIMV